MTRWSMCDVSLHIFIYTYMYMHIHVYIYIHIYVNIYIYIYIYISIHLNALHIWIHNIYDVHICNTYIHTFIRIYARTYIQISINVHVYIYIYVLYIYVYFMNIIFVHPWSRAAVCVRVYCVILFRGQPNQRYVYDFKIGTKDMGWLRLVDCLKL